MSATNATRHKEWHKTCKRKCRLDASVCNNKKRCNKDKCRCECKELIDQGIWDKEFIWNPSNCECECNKSCDVAEFLDYENCRRRKKVVDKLVEECTENAEDVTLAKITSTEHDIVCKSSSTIYVAMLLIIFKINIGIGTYFVYYRYMNHDKKNCCWRKFYLSNNHLIKWNFKRIKWLQMLKA